ncbi:hypothetical protein A3Q56_02904 [Intoshia linei]|uniref:Uncharacterized protein n=1 Tax=Intoshia linei TaxID=1819745 RepID=A0A177B7G7_9BILA|nr:hypothetical protein A3Q56_02904 [Intoshia linei]
MNNYIKSKINRCKTIIEENIVIDENFLNKAKQLDVFTTSVIENIQNNDSRASKIECMLEALTIQHESKWEFFCNALQISGQKFLTYLISEENNELTNECKKIVANGISKYTHIDINVTTSDKNKLINYISEKIKSKLLLEIYNGCIQENDKTMQVREIHINDIIKYIKKIKENNKKICSISTESNNLYKKLIKSDERLKIKIDQLNQLRRNSVVKLKIRSRFYKANEKFLFRIQNGLMNIQDEIDSLDQKIKLHVKPEKVSTNKISTISNDFNEKNLINTNVTDDDSNKSDGSIINTFCAPHFQNNVDHLINRMKSLENQIDTLTFYRMQYDDLQNHLSLAIKSLVPKYDYIELNFETKNQIKSFKSSEIDTNTKMKNLNENFSVYQHLYVKYLMEEYENKIKLQDKEIDRLMKQLQEKESNLVNNKEKIESAKRRTSKKISELNIEHSRIKKYSLNSKNMSDKNNHRKSIIKKNSSINTPLNKKKSIVQKKFTSITKLDFNID